MKAQNVRDPFTTPEQNTSLEIFCATRLQLGDQSKVGATVDDMSPIYFNNRHFLGWALFDRLRLYLKLSPV